MFPKDKVPKKSKISLKDCNSYIENKNLKSLENNIIPLIPLGRNYNSLLFFCYANGLLKVRSQIIYVSDVPLVSVFFGVRDHPFYIRACKVITTEIQVRTGTMRSTQR